MDSIFLLQHCPSCHPLATWKYPSWPHFFPWTLQATSHHTLRKALCALVSFTFLKSFSYHPLPCSGAPHTKASLVAGSIPPQSFPFCHHFSPVPQVASFPPSPGFCSVSRSAKLFLTPSHSTNFFPLTHPSRLLLP